MKKMFFKRMMPIHHLHHPMFRFGPCHPHKKLNSKKPFGVKFGNTEYINFPKEEKNTINVSNESNENNAL